MSSKVSPTGFRQLLRARIQARRFSGCGSAEAARFFQGVHVWLVKTNGSILGWVNSPPILVYSADWDVHWGYDLASDPYGLLTHGLLSMNSSWGECPAIREVVVNMKKNTLPLDVFEQSCG